MTKQVKIKAWAVVWTDDAKICGNWSSNSLAIFPTKHEARFGHKHYAVSKVMPVTITYQLPVKKK